MISFGPPVTIAQACSTPSGPSPARRQACEGEERPIGRVDVEGLLPGAAWLRLPLIKAVSWDDAAPALEG
jgi:hypothetical protein